MLVGTKEMNKNTEWSPLITANKKTLPFILIIGTFAFTACSSDPVREHFKHLARGEKYFKARKFNEAVVELRNATQLNPKSADAHYQLGRAYLALGKQESAIRELISAVTLDAVNWGAQLDLASLMLERRQYEQAEAIAKKVLQSDPKNARAHDVLAEKYLRTQNLPNAVLELQKAIDLDPGQFARYDALGNVYRAANQVEAAETSFKKAVEVEPKSVQARVALSQFHLSQGKTNEAIEAMRMACMLDPKFVPSQLFLGQIYTRSRNVAEAERVYATLRKNAPNDPQAYQALGIFYMATGQKEKAIAEFQSLAATKPKDISVRAHLVDSLIELRRIPEADKQNQEMLKAHPSDLRFTLAKGRILIARGRYEEARTTLYQTVLAEPKSATGHYYLGVTQKALGLSDSAKASFSKALELSPAMSEAAVELADLQISSGDHSSGSYDDAIQLADKALQTAPNSSAAYLASARGALAKGDFEQAQKRLNEALAREPMSLPALGFLMNLSIKKGTSAAAIQQISALIQQHPQVAGLHFLLALGYFNLKDLNRSEASVRTAISLDARTPDAYALLANIDFANGKPENAKSELRAAIAANPRAAFNYISLARQLEKELNWAEARKLFEKAHELDPLSSAINAELAFLNIEHGGDLNIAIDLAQKAKKQTPDSPFAADALGWAYYKLGAPEPAIAQLKTSAQKALGNPMYQYHLGMAYLATKDYDSARRCLQAALKSDPNFLDAERARTALSGIDRNSQRLQ
jgi:tetratricopeptide (TPR) repeat protein